MSIDVYAPGRLLTIPFLCEQIWLHPEGGRLVATEVYDFILQADDNRGPLKSFFVGSPHFCRLRRGREWQDRVRLLDVGGHDTGWGWFYDSEDRDKPNHILSLEVPTSVYSEQQELITYSGLDVPGHQIHWFDNDPENPVDWSVRTELMRTMKKSLYRVDIAEGYELKPMAGNRLWFRLGVAPVVLDLQPIIPEAARDIVELLTPTEYVLWTSISCPAFVRRRVHTGLKWQSQEAKVDLHMAAQVARLEDALVTDGFNAKGTSTRIEDHRVLLGGYPSMQIQVFGDPGKAILYFGAMNPKVRLPQVHGSIGRRVAECLHWAGRKLGTRPRGLGLVRAFTVERPRNVIVHVWAGGSVRNGERDLVATAWMMLNEIWFNAGRSSKEKLAITVTPSSYKDGCVLLENMSKCGLLKIDDKSYCTIEDGVTGTPARQPSVEGQCTLTPVGRERICELRRLYLDPVGFGLHQEWARYAFLDLHAFRCTFQCRWFRSALRSALLLSVWGMSLAAFVLSIVALIR